MVSTRVGMDGLGITGAGHGAIAIPPRSGWHGTADSAGGRGGGPLGRQPDAHEGGHGDRGSWARPRVTAEVLGQPLSPAPPQRSLTLSPEPAPAGPRAGIPSLQSFEQLSPPLELKWLGDCDHRRWESPRPGSPHLRCALALGKPWVRAPWGSPASALWARCLWDTS